MFDQENRRQFLTKTASLTLAGLASKIAEANDKQKKMIPIIDTHQHLWDLKKFRLPWIKPGSILAKDHLMSDYLKATEGLNIVKTIYMEVDLDQAQQKEEAEFVIETCKRGDTPMVAGVISGRPNSEGFAKYITPFKGNRYLNGVRQILHAQPPAALCLVPKVIKGIRLFGGDWPVCTQVATYKEWLRALQAIVKERREEQQRKLFHDNAVRVYGLD